jgi:hypothetical protein
MTKLCTLQTTLDVALAPRPIVPPNLLSRTSAATTDDAVTDDNAPSSGKARVSQRLLTALVGSVVTTAPPTDVHAGNATWRNTDETACAKASEWYDNDDDN